MGGSCSAELCSQGSKSIATDMDRRGSQRSTQNDMYNPKPIKNGKNKKVKKKKHKKRKDKHHTRTGSDKSLISNSNTSTSKTGTSRTSTPKQYEQIEFPPQQQQQQTFQTTPYIIPINTDSGNTGNISSPKQPNLHHMRSTSLPPQPRTYQQFQQQYPPLNISRPISSRMSNIIIQPSNNIQQQSFFNTPPPNYNYNGKINQIQQIQPPLRTTMSNIPHGYISSQMIINNQMRNSMNMNLNGNLNINPGFNYEKRRKTEPNFNFNKVNTSDKNIHRHKLLRKQSKRGWSDQSLRKLEDDLSGQVFKLREINRLEKKKRKLGSLDFTEENELIALKQVIEYQHQTIETPQSSIPIDDNNNHNTIPKFAFNSNNSNKSSNKSNNNSNKTNSRSIDNVIESGLVVISDIPSETDSENEKNIKTNQNIKNAKNDKKNSKNGILKLSANNSTQTQSQTKLFSPITNDSNSNFTQSPETPMPRSISYGTTIMHSSKTTRILDEDDFNNFNDESDDSNSNFETTSDDEEKVNENNENSIYEPIDELRSDMRRHITTVSDVESVVIHNFDNDSNLSYNDNNELSETQDSRINSYTINNYGGNDSGGDDNDPLDHLFVPPKINNNNYNKKKKKRKKSSKIGEQLTVLKQEEEEINDLDIFGKKIDV